jgi:hypothetical protein
MLYIDPASGKEHRRAALRRIAAGAAPNPLENALSIPESDPERIAFNLWNEGKVDEAIAFLEREIASRKDRYEPAADAASLIYSGSPEVKPISDWRDRHRALGAAEFNALGSPVRTIDLVAGPGVAIVPNPPRRKIRPAWVMGLVLAAIGLSSAGALWSTHAGAPPETALAAVDPVEPTLVKREPTADLAPTPQPKPYIAAAGANADAGTVKSVPIVTDARDEADEAPPPDEGAPATDLALDETPAPETTASIGSDNEAPGTAEPAPVVEARLPRQRPEPPAAPPRAARVDRQEQPTLRSLSRQGDTVRYFDPNDPPARLTPAEYQALLERRAWAENYVLRRRAYAERRAQFDQPADFPGALDPFIRLQQD